MRKFIDQFRARALDMMSADAAVEPYLHDFCLAMQAQLPGSFVGVNVLDRPGETFEHSIFPSLPGDFGDSIKGRPMRGAEKGSCGAAVLTGSLIDVTDIMHDERFTPGWRDLFLAQDIHAVLSVPVISTDGIAQGALAISYAQAKPLNARQRAAIGFAAQLCATVMVYSRNRSGRRLVLGELDHRTRNLFGQFGALAQLTQRHYPATADFRRELNDRLGSLARAQAIGLDGAEIDLATLLKEVLSPYSADYPITLFGPSITLSREAGAAFALATHELATNAVKYGALSVVGGGLNVNWSLAPDVANGALGFSLTWLEYGGPPVSQPSRSGYGTVTINGSIRSAFDGVADRAFLPGGLRCVISAPFTPRLGVQSQPAALLH
ncbi:HWE histidine kinase domain-containing protein [Pseudomonadota bacterium AL_CKDN230030165-1A_HGKHYDSX7]